MAMIQKRGEPLPKDAVLLPRSDAHKYQLQILQEWEPKSEVWAYRYGVHALSVASMLTSLLIHRHYRKSLKLRNHGLMSTYLPTVVIPTLGTTFAHLQWVTKNILQMNYTCPVCIGTKAMLLQSFFGVAYPLVLSPLCSFTFAVRKFTYRMPYYNDVRGHYDMWLKLTKPLTGKIALMVCFHAILASVVTYAEDDQVVRVREKLTRFAQNEQ